MIDNDYYKQLLSGFEPKYAGAVFEKSELIELFAGENIKAHITGCQSVLVCACTLGEEFDRFMRKMQLSDMAGAVHLDRLAGGKLQNFCNKKDREIIAGRESTTRYSPGYGDLPLSINSVIINILNATTRIGLHTTDSHMMTPQKSITGIVGIKENREK